MDEQQSEAEFLKATAEARPQMHRLIAALREATSLLLDTSLGEPELEAAADAAEVLVEQLRETQAAHPAARSWARREARTPETWGLSETSPISGIFNIIAPPLELRFEGNDAVGSGTFGQQYEGPPGHVHGGFVAAAFDDVLGMVQGITGHAGMTGTLIVRYRRATPLHAEVVFRAKVDRVEGRKLFTSATLHYGDQLCAEAEGIFIRVAEGHFERLRDESMARNRNA
jgi:acyl-coenzyme A thioesterase PaaI-like protein